MAVKFESCNSKGLSRNGTPHEWAVYQKIAGLYGIPRVFAKGQIGQYYVLVCSGACHLHARVLTSCIPDMLDQLGLVLAGWALCMRTCIGRCMHAP